MTGHSDRAFRGLRQLARSERLTVTVRGECMAPLVPSGSEVEVRNQKLYLPGDVLVYRLADGGLAAHRLIGFVWRPSRGLELVTATDTAEGADPVIGADRVLGRVCGGHCPPVVASVPWTQRLRSLGRFTRHLARRLG